MRARAIAVVACALLAMGAAGCAPAEEAGTSGSAMTVPRGDRFVETIDGDEVVLKREVDGIAFPFDKAGIVGRALLIHPVAGKSETGVYARALSVEETSTHYTVTTKPLLFDEMESIPEDEVIRIYLDRSLATLSGGSSTQSLNGDGDPFGLDTRVRPLGFSGLALGQPEVRGWVTLAPWFSTGGTFRATFEDADLSVTPRVKVGYQRGRGLELGASFDLQWSAVVSMEGSVQAAGPLFTPPPIPGPMIVVVIPIGAVPVPVTIGLTARTGCKANGGLDLEGRLRPDVGLSVGGSSFIKPSADPSRWVTPGEWPYHATGNASATFDGNVGPGLEVACWLPRIDLGAKVAGLAGPELSLVAFSTTTSQGTTMSAALRMGVRAELFGKGAVAEVDLVSWSPDR